ncbi:MAG: hypothetical protein QNK37_28760 [Acidobacteriota bacterium]|nr:hypothetical protein [Acidobacteriota bacterium]
MKLNRRQFIKTGIAGSLLLGAAGYVTHGVFWGGGKRSASVAGRTCRFFTRRQAQTLKPMIPVVLGEALPTGPSTAGLVDEVLLGMDVNIAALPLAAKQEISALLTILALAPTRWLAAGVWSSWSNASPETIRAFLDRWHASGSLMLRSGADALCMLIAASWYGNPKSWAGVGYPGPPKVGNLKEVSP